MEEKKNQENKKKSDWSVKKVLTTIIIAVLALLMVGSLYYIIILVQQDKDESNVFGHYNGEAIKYEAGSAFYNSLNGNQDYITAATNGDAQGIYQAWYQAYQTEVVYTALKQMAEEAGIVVPQSLVDEMIVGSGLYASEDGSKTFDEEVYKAASQADRSVTYQYYTKLFPYFVVVNDYQTVLASDFEKNFVTELAKNTRSFDYYVVGSNVYPDDLALAYDISEMPVEEGKEASLEEIKAYIFAKEPETVKPYIEEAVAKISSGISFEDAAENIASGVIEVENAVNNVGGSTYFYNDVRSADPEGYLAAAMNIDLAKELYNAEAGYETDPIEVNGSYIVVRVKSTEETEAAASLLDTLYNYYSSSVAVNTLASQIMTSDKFDDRFMEKFLPILMNGMGGLSN